MQKVYRESVASAYQKLIIDFFLCFILIGIPLIVKHWLQYTRNTITLGDTTLVLKKGVLTVDTTDIPYAKINTVSIKVGMLGKLFNYGDIVIYSGNDTSGIEFKGIESPELLKKEIQNKQAV